MRPETKQILENIANLRKIKGIKQATIAQKMGIDASTYSKIESGTIDLTIDRLAELASVFQLSIINLISYPKTFIDQDLLPYELRKVKASLQIELTEDKKDQVLKLVFGDNIIEILNK